MKKEAAIICGN